MKIVSWLLCVSLAIGAASCASAPSAKDPIPGAATDLNGFVGGWSGSWSEETTTGSKLEGTAELSVDKDGKVTGKMTNKTLNMDGTVAGTVVEGGVTRVDFVYPKATLNGQGRVGVKEGKLQGVIDVSQSGSKAGTLTFLLSKGP